jgi:hypothetical protein
MPVIFPICFVKQDSYRQLFFVISAPVVSTR